MTKLEPSRLEFQEGFKELEKNVNLKEEDDEEKRERGFGGRRRRRTGEAGMRRRRREDLKEQRECGFEEVGRRE